MKVTYEIMATVLALGGAAALGFVYFPILNPVQEARHLAVISLVHPLQC